MTQWHGGGTTLRLHGDCHAGNILWRDGPLFVDLDDARTGPAIQDLWMLLNGDKAEQRMQLETIVEAYEEFSPLTAMKSRLLNLYAPCDWFIIWRGCSDAGTIRLSRLISLVNRGGLLARADVYFSRAGEGSTGTPLQLTPMY